MVPMDGESGQQAKRRPPSTLSRRRLQNAKVMARDLLRDLKISKELEDMDSSRRRRGRAPPLNKDVEPVDIVAALDEALHLARDFQRNHCSARGA